MASALAVPVRPTAPLLLIAAAALLAGALVPALAGPDVPEGAPGRASAVAGLTALTSRTLVSEPGHRVSEFSVAIDPTDPRKVLVGTMDWDHATGGVACVTYRSNDGGRTWEGGEAIVGLEGPRARLDPWVSVGPDGAHHLLCMDYTGTPGTAPGVVLKHAVSPAGDGTWHPAAPIPLLDPERPVDKNAVHVAADGTIHVCVNHGDLVTARSADGGATWQARAHGFSGNCNGFAEGPDGELHVAFLSLEAAPPFWTGVLTTRDGGATWDPPALVAASERPANNAFADIAVRSATGPIGSFQQVAASPVSDTLLFVVPTWDVELLGWTYALARSSDGGVTWEALAPPLFASPTCPGCHVVHPMLAADAAGRFALELTLSEDRGLVRETYLFVSDDAGATWTGPLQVARTQVPETALGPGTWSGHAGAFVTDLERAGPLDEGYPWVLVLRGQRVDHLRWGGDYWTFAATEEGFLVFWIDHLDGRPQLWTRLVGLTT